MSRYARYFAYITIPVVVAACDDSLTEPVADEPQLAVAAAANNPADVYAFGDPPTPVEGSSRLTVNGRGVAYNLTTSGLMPGHTYTMWLVVFNTPSGCTDMCGEDDLFNPDATVDIVYGAGNVVGRNGKATFGGHRSVGDASGSVFGALGAPAAGLMDPMTAEIHLVVRDHGPTVAGMVRDQIRTFEGQCTPESSFGLGDGTYACADVQFSVHLAQN